MWHTGAGMGWWMMFGSLLWLVFWGTIVYLVVWFVRDRQSTQQDRREEPIELAKRRYASGQITCEEYDRIRHDLAA
jgi:putative membrane protein